MKVFIDTGPLIAIFVERDVWHKKCMGKYETYKEDNAMFFTNTFVISEFYTRILYDYGAGALKLVIAKITDLQNKGKLRVFQIDGAIFLAAEEAMIKFSEHKLSFTDSTIYAVSKNFKLDEVFTLDKGFKKIGLSTSF